MLAHVTPLLALLSQGMTGYLLSVGRVNNQLGWGDAYYAGFKHILLGYYVLVALPVDAGLLINDLLDGIGGVVMIKRKRLQIGMFFLIAINGPLLCGAMDAQVVKLPTIKEALLQVPEGSFYL